MEYPEGETCSLWGLSWFVGRLL